MTMLTELASHLQTNSVGTIGTDLFYTFFPDDVDRGLCLYEEAGAGPGFVLGAANTAPYLQRNLQIITRAVDYPTCEALANQAYDLLFDVTNLVLSGKTYYRIMAIAQPFPYQIDDNDRWEFSTNYEVTRQR